MSARHDREAPLLAPFPGTTGTNARTPASVARIFHRPLARLATPPATKRGEARLQWGGLLATISSRYGEGVSSGRAPRRYGHGAKDDPAT